MNIIYIISVILLFISFLFFKRIDTKENILVNIMINIAVFFCFNIFVTYINYCLHIGSDLLIISIINYILSIIFIICNKKNGLQEYYFNKKELIVSIIIFIILFIIGLIRFDNITTISYESGDSSVHYLMAKNYSEVMDILNKSNVNDIVYEGFNYRPGYYINAGIFLKLVNFIPTYKAYILFDILIFAFGGLLFYATLIKNNNNNNNSFLSILIVMLYTLGYMLNNLIFGFGYLGLGIIIVNIILLLITLIDYQRQVLFNIIILFIINFALFFTYYLFVPIFYLSEGLYFIYIFIKKRIKFKELSLYGIITLIIPFIIGMLYFIYPTFLGSNNKGALMYSLKDFGYIYTGNLLIFIMLIHVIMKISFSKQKNKISKESLFETICFFATLLMMGVFLTLMITEGIKDYYYCKLLFILWLIIFVLYIKIFDVNKIKKIIYLFSIIMIISATYNWFNTNNYLSVLSIYAYNFSKFKNENILLNKDDIKLIDKSKNYYNECKTKDIFLISGDRQKNQWYYALSSHLPIDNYVPGYIRTLQNETKNIIASFSTTDQMCLIYFFEDEKINYYDNEILYENVSGAILKRKN